MLTESHILSKAGVASLDDVTTLNIWGHNLKDITIVSKLSNARVLSMSVNSVQSLEPFGGCHGLEELYLRKNSIPNIDDVLHLRVS